MSYRCHIENIPVARPQTCVFRHRCKPLYINGPRTLEDPVMYISCGSRDHLVRPTVFPRPKWNGLAVLSKSSSYLRSSVPARQLPLPSCALHNSGCISSLLPCWAYWHPSITQVFVLKSPPRSRYGVPPGSANVNVTSSVRSRFSGRVVGILKSLEPILFGSSAYVNLQDVMHETSVQLRATQGLRMDDVAAPGCCTQRTVWALPLIFTASSCY